MEVSTNVSSINVAEISALSSHMSGVIGHEQWKGHTFCVCSMLWDVMAYMQDSAKNKVMLNY
jgi:hypothetical protein